MRHLSATFLALLMTFSLALNGCSDDEEETPSNNGGPASCDPACGDGQECVDGACQDVTHTCTPACTDGQECVHGTCQDVVVTCDPACSDDQECIDGTCQDMTHECTPACTDGQECVHGTCQDVVPVCEPACADGQECVDGACQDVVVTCDPACADGQECVDGTCQDVVVTCDPACADGQECVDGACQPIPPVCDPACTEGQTCVAGVCVANNPHVGLAELAGPFDGGPAVTSACIGCHPDEGQQMLGSAHFLWAGHTPDVVNFDDTGDIGKKNLVNNFCVATPSNEQRCAQCHAGYGLGTPEFSATDPSRVDCLVCHAQGGTYKKGMTNWGNPDPTVNLVAAAQAIGAPTTKNCGSCHFAAGGGDGVKKGDMGSWMATATREADVHIGSGMTCATCHATEGHRLAGTGTHVPVKEAPLSCTDATCHTTTPHTSELTNNHTAHVACQTCHIPAFARQMPTKVDWRWSEAGDQNRQPVLDQYGMPDYDPKKGEVVWGMNVAPTLAWYNGDTFRLGMGEAYVPSNDPIDIASPVADISDMTARIYPFKVMRGNQPVDTVNHTLIVPHLFGQSAGPNPYWGVWDWNAANTEGMAAAGVTYSGTWEFLPTTMTMRIDHEVAPKEMARACTSCHMGGIDFTELGYTGDPMDIGGRGM